MENEQVTVIWDMKIQKDKEIEHYRPDILIRCNKSRKCYVVDFACLFDTRMNDKERKGRKIPRSEKGIEENMAASKNNPNPGHHWYPRHSKQTL